MNEKKEFRTWDNWCLKKLKERGRLTLIQWATAMGYKNSGNISNIVKHNTDKLKITKNSVGRVKFYELREDVIL